ncbi:MAG: hemerythrin domain-containing protein [Planctomycetes bacterium]|nr:hemerythrin domain-containing protein [Planctomycetota bacterium]
MSELIKKLKEEHSEIITTLNEIKKLGIHSEEGRSRLRIAKALFLGHLKHEDEQLYPVLRKEAEQNENVSRELDILAVDPEHVSRVVEEFFDKYTEGVISKDFSINFESLFATLNSRITHEEESLYPEFELIEKSKE